MIRQLFRKINTAGSKRLGAIFAILVALAIFLIYFLMTYAPQWNDEYVHIYVAQQVAKGRILYGDIHSARPPLTILLPSLLLKIGLGPLLTARGLVLLAILATGGLLYWFGRQLGGSVVGIAALVLWLLSPTIATRAVYTGINLVTLFSFCCVMFAVIKRPGISGLFGALALLTGQHAVVLVGITLVYVGLDNKRALLRFIGAGFALGVGVIVPIILVGGSDIYQDLVGQHLYHVSSKTAVGDAKIGWWSTVLILENLAWFLLLVAAWLIGPLTQQDQKGIINRFDPLVWLTSFATIHLLVVLLMRGSLALYLHPALPLVCLVAAIGFHRLFERVRHILSAAQSKKNRSARPWTKAARKTFVGVFTIVILVPLGWWSAGNQFSQRDQSDYSWLPHLRYLQMARLRTTHVAFQIRDYIQEKSRNKGTLFGHPIITSQIAVFSQRKIAHDLSDLHTRLIRQGVVKRQELVAWIEEDGIEFFITPRWFYYKDPFFKKYLDRCFDSPRLFNRLPDSGIPPILVYQHRVDKAGCRVYI